MPRIAVIQRELNVVSETFLRAHAERLQDVVGVIHERHGRLWCNDAPVPKTWSLMNPSHAIRQLWKGTSCESRFANAYETALRSCRPWRRSRVAPRSSTGRSACGSSFPANAHDSRSSFTFMAMTPAGGPCCHGTRPRTATCSRVRPLSSPCLGRWSRRCCHWIVLVTRSSTVRTASTARHSTARHRAIDRRHSWLLAAWSRKKRPAIRSGRSPTSFGNVRRAGCG